MATEQRHATLARRLAWTGALTALPLASTLAAGGDSQSGQAEIVGHVIVHQKISQTAGEFFGLLDDQDEFGSRLAAVGDLDGDGTVDLAVGASHDGDGGDDRGAIWIVFLHPDGTVKGYQKISTVEGGFAGVLDDNDRFGRCLAALGDLDGDGTPDLAVGASGDDDGATDSGAVWILFLHPNGTVKGHQKISATEGGFTGVLADSDFFGSAAVSAGDLDGGGIAELAIGAPGDDDGGPSRGAVWLLFLDADGTVESHQKISSVEGGFGGPLADIDRFGFAVAALGDLDRDGTEDLAVGARGDNDGGDERGAVWILFLLPDGTVGSHQKISDLEGGFTGTLDDNDEFGGDLAAVGDLDCDGNVDLAAGARLDDDGGEDRGAVWVLFLASNGSVRLHTKISDTSGSFNGALDDDDRFGDSLAALGDLDGDGLPDLAVGAPQDDDGGLSRGAVWNLFLDGVVCSGSIFEDGFESGDTGAWSATVS
jgi:hypothetical protein